jgi:hypothetical protein
MQQTKPKSAAPTARPETSEELIESDGRWHIAHRVMTTCKRLAEAGYLPRHLHAAAEFYGMKLNQAEGVAVHDHDQSTSRLISNWDGLPIDPNTYRSRTPTNDERLDARTFIQSISARCPAEFFETFTMITKEEASQLTGKPMTLTQIGARFGFKAEKQCSAGGRVHIVDVLSWLNYEQQDFEQRFPPSRDGSRKSLHLRLKAAKAK